MNTCIIKTIVSVSKIESKFSKKKRFHNNLKYLLEIFPISREYLTENTFFL